MASREDYFSRCQTTLEVHDELMTLLVCDFLKPENASLRFRMNCRSDVTDAVRDTASVEKFLNHLERTGKLSEGNYDFIKRKVERINVAITDLIFEAERKIEEIRENSLKIETSVTEVEPVDLEKETRSRVNALLLSVSEFLMCKSKDLTTQIDGLWERHIDLQTLSYHFLSLWHTEYCKCQKRFGQQMLLQFIEFGAGELKSGQNEYDFFRFNLVPRLWLFLNESVKCTCDILREYGATPVSFARSSVLSYWIFDRVTNLDRLWAKYEEGGLHVDLQNCLNSEETLRLLKVDRISLKMTIQKSDYFKYRNILDVVSPGEVILKAGDKVIVNLTLQAFKQLQDNEAYGSWNDDMIQCTEEIGTIVQTLLEGYTMQLQYEDAKKWLVNRAALTRKHTFTIGEAVQVLSDVNAVQDLQVGHGGWNRNMAPYLGKAGRLVKIDSDGDMIVKINGTIWVFNPVCISPITDPDTAEKVTKLSESDMKRAEEDQDLDFTKVLGLDNVAEAFAQPFVDMPRERAENELSRVTIVQAAGDGNLDVVKEIVKRSPGKIDQTVDGKTALHVSSFQGHNEVVAFLLENKADVNLTDNEGNTSLHHSAFGKEPAIMKLLLGCNADVDAVNKNGQTSLHVSIGKAVLACVKLLREKRAKCTIKDHSGDTAMHLAIIVGNPDIMKCVLGSSRVDFAVANGKGFNVLQWAVLKKSSSAVDFILSRKKNVIEAKTADGQTALHIAASNGFVEIVSALIFKGKCDINVKDKKKRTPLMLAVAGTHKRTTEILLKAEGIEINAQDESGNTALHIAQKSGASSYDGTVSSEIICNLVEAKADIDLENKNGKTPLDLAADSETRKRMQEIAQKARKNTFATTVSGHRLPSHWQIGLDEGTTIKRVPLSQKDKMMKSEWDQVCERFYDTLPQAEVIEIERVQNAFCWETYTLKKKNLEKKYGVGCANELQLFHGTNYDIVDRICQENFDFRRSGTSTGAIYGHGAYFSMNAKYSDGYATRGERGKYMFLAKCLVGKYTSGRRSYRKPPDIDENDNTKGAYDSCVDNTTKPRIYCIFDSNQYYPEYVILYR